MRRSRFTRLFVQQLERRDLLTGSTLDLTIEIQDGLPDATNPYESINPALSESNNQIYATTYGTIGGETYFLTWDAMGEVTPRPLSELTIINTVTTQPIQSGQTTVTVQDATGIVPGMRAFGGVPVPAGTIPGQALADGALVVKVDGTVVTLNVPTPFSANVGGIVTFVQPVPDQLVGQVNTAGQLVVHLPVQQLNSFRTIFTLGAHGWATPNVISSAAGGEWSCDGSPQPVCTWTTAGVQAPSPTSSAYYEEIYFDFVEFTLDVANTGGQDVATKFTFNTSSIDQFGFPVQIGVIPDNPGPVGGAGVTVTREEFFRSYATFIDNEVPAGARQDFFQSLILAGQGADSAPLRLLSPASGITYNAPVDDEVTSFFDEQITRFFNRFDPNSPEYGGQPFTMFNVPGSDSTGKGPSDGRSNLHDLQGTVVTINDANGLPRQRVLRLTDMTAGIGSDLGYGWYYDIYEPFFSSNGYGVDAPAPPTWLLGSNESPAQMVFAASGVFASSAQQTAPDGQAVNGTYYMVLLGAIENQIATALNRGIVMQPQTTWLFQSAFWNATPEVLVNAGNTLSVQGYVASLAPGMSVTGPGIAAGAKVVDVGPAVQTGGVWGSTVTLDRPNTSGGGPAVAATFFYDPADNPFYLPSPENPHGTWNYYSQFLHQESVSIHGLAYAYAYDDQGGFSSTIVSGAANVTPTGATVTLGTPAPQAREFPLPAPGTAVVAEDPFAPGTQALFVWGTDARDVIRVREGRNGQLEVRLGTRLLGTFAGVDGSIVIHGLQGDDQIRLDPRVTQPAWIDGGDGNDLIVSDGSGADMLLGGDGDDVIIDGRGRNVFIGGDGRDRLISAGGQAGQENLLLTGSTIWNSHAGYSPTAADLDRLAAIWQIWASGESFARRVELLSTGAGPVLNSSTIINDDDLDSVFHRPHIDWLLDHMLP